MILGFSTICININITLHYITLHRNLIRLLLFFFVLLNDFFDLRLKPPTPIFFLSLDNKDLFRANKTVDLI